MSLPTQTPEPVGRFPRITAVEWLSASTVLGGEASDFTPWLSQPDNLESLGRVLHLEDLSAVAVEQDVSGLRLDILATAFDENGNEIDVCIENQYGTTDGSHLGRLIAYLAQRDGGRAVWVVEDASDPFIEAVRFLNRTSTDESGYYLVRVRFTHGSAGAYQVHFETLAAPSTWERGRSLIPRRQADPTKVAYINAVRDQIAPAFEAAGISSFNTRGSYLRAAWPLDLWWRQAARRFSIRTPRDVAAVVVYSREFGPREANRAAIEILRQEVGAELEALVPSESEVRWFAGAAGESENVRVELPGAGFVGGDPQSTARWTWEVVDLWLRLLREHPIHDLRARVEARTSTLDEDDTSLEVDE